MIVAFMDWIMIYLGTCRWRKTPMIMCVNSHSINVIIWRVFYLKWKLKVQQDAGMVEALLEIAINTIVAEPPFIKQGIITSDYAMCYQNQFVIFMIAIYNQKFNGQFFIESFIHLETQDVKSLLDAHFATSSRHLRVLMKTWKSNRVTRIITLQVDRRLLYQLI